MLAPQQKVIRCPHLIGTPFVVGTSTPKGNGSGDTESCNLWPVFDAKRFRDLLIERGISQGELARRIGVSQQTISRLASGERYGTKHLHRIARELGTTPAYLVREADDPTGEASDVPPLSSDERQWLDVFAALRPDQRRALQLIARDLALSTMASARLHDNRQSFGMPDQG